jgi:carboxymethylenebutenolidase
MLHCLFVRVAVCLAVALLADALLSRIAHAGAAGVVQAPVRESHDKFPSEGKDIAVERFEPHSLGPHPAVLLLHGCDGFSRHGPRLRDQARHLAGNGYVCLLVHYFDRDGLTEVAPEDIREHFPGWMLTILDALKYAATLKQVDATRIGLLGHSLGAYLAVSVGLAKGHRHVAAVVEYYGGLPAELLLLPFVKLENMPPTLLLHGEKDDVVPVQAAHDLARLLRGKDRPYELVLYPEQGHVFRGKDELDSARRSLQFLNKHLKPEKSLAGGRLGAKPGGR